MPLIRAKYGPNLVVDGGLENWTDDTNLTSWIEAGVDAGVRDITKESTEKHGGSYAAKFQATDNDGTNFYISQSRTLVANKCYSLSGWYHFPTRTAGIVGLSVYNGTDGSLSVLATTSTTAEYTYAEGVVKPTVGPNNAIIAQLNSETTTGILYFDDISVRLLYPRRLGK